MAAIGVGAAGAGLQVLFSALGSARAERDFRRAEQIVEQIAREWEGLQLPGAEDIRLTLPRAAAVSGYDPATVQAFLADPSQLDSYQFDAEFDMAGREALRGLQDITSSGGLTSADRGMLREVSMEEAAAERAQREALAQGAAMRGIGGSGFQLAQQMDAQQQGANRAASQARQVEALALQRQLAALGQQGGLARGLGQDDFARAQGIASQADIISRFNAQQQQSASTANAAATNTMQGLAMGDRQQVRNLNQQAGTVEAQAAANAPLQLFDAERAKLQGVSSAKGALADVAVARGQRRAGTYDAMGGAFGQIAAPIATSMVKRGTSGTSP